MGVILSRIGVGKLTKVNYMPKVGEEFLSSVVII